MTKHVGFEDFGLNNMLNFVISFPQKQKKRLALTLLLESRHSMFVLKT